jgi:hypothetical protein
VDKKRDFCQNRMFHRGNFLELLLEKSEETAPDKLVQFLLMFLIQNPIASQQTEALLRQRL